MLRYGLLAGFGISVAVAVACSSSNTSGPIGGGNNSSGSGGTAAHGESLVDSYGCRDCHGNDMAGQTTPVVVPGVVARCVTLYPPNLTPDNDTGVGKWTDGQLQNAIINGVDNEGLSLCPEMKHYKDAGADDVNDMIAYLRAIPAVNKTIPSSTCPPLKGECDGGI
jgi:hypothetical protein